MTSTLERFKTELATLSTNERAELAQFLIHSLDDESEESVEAAWDAELARRVESIQRGEDNGEPADGVFQALREKYS